MKKFLLGAVALGFLAAAPLAVQAANGKAEVTAASLQSEGWTIVNKAEQKKVLPGLPPYENLERVVQHVTYHLQKDGTMMTCEAAYDSQQDNYSESCRLGAH